MGVTNKKGKKRDGKKKAVESDCRKRELPGTTGGVANMSKAPIAQLAGREREGWGSCLGSKTSEVKGKGELILFLFFAGQFFFYCPIH